MNPNVLASIITASVAVISVVVSSIITVSLSVFEKKNARKAALIDLRREAFLPALEVVDHVYANTSFNNREPSNPHSWDIKQAHRAMNIMLMYCENQRETIAQFAAAVGLHDMDDATTRKPYGPKQLSEFRKSIRRELQIPGVPYDDKNIAWIDNLPGSKTIRITANKV